ncbi:hypothetical protein Psi02_06030 [Planotetraspora silvatica]|uniref:DUF4097 domain-containing protein n=1 Tax=Planotetraspora silvatica TaxID=234614 RepID=A0A8J3XK73_9ACTN|nr:DUF4097 family beta strand repeat-containing protein [Planotetraspora silvatica]GII44179.1 hypothetical protein Psi02_06030 [Planotetraspora silvatica]
MRKQSMIIVGVALGSALTLTACGTDIDLSKVGFGGEQAVQSYDVTDAITALHADTGAGEIVINESDRAGVHVTETLHWRGDKPQNGHQVDAGTLTLRYRCDDCSVDYEVEVPKGLDVKVDSGSGTITLRRLTGPVSAATGSGDIEARGLAGRQVTATTGSGEVKLRFAAAPDNVRVETGSGEGSVWVPSGSYNVTAEPGSGDREVSVVQDPSSARTVVVKTGSGDARVLKA